MSVSGPYALAVWRRNAAMYKCQYGECCSEFTSVV